MSISSNTHQIRYQNSDTTHRGDSIRRIYTSNCNVIFPRKFSYHHMWRCSKLLLPYLMDNATPWNHSQLWCSYPGQTATCALLLYILRESLHSITMVHRLVWIM